jgi:hypothetical protein
MVWVVLLPAAIDPQFMVVRVWVHGRFEKTPMLGAVGGDVGVGDGDGVGVGIGVGVGVVVGGGGGGGGCGVGVMTVMMPEEFTFWFTVMAAKVVAASVKAITVSVITVIFESLEASKLFPLPDNL